MAKFGEDFNTEQGQHCGKWTREEEDYVNALIEEFKEGLLPLAEGTSLRTFLSKMLNCAPMRISKKFVGSNYNGKRVYVRRKNDLSNDEVRSRRAKLQELERKFLAKSHPMSAGAFNQSSDSVPTSAVAAVNTSASQVSFNAEAAAVAMFGNSGRVDSAAALLGGKSNSKAAAAGRALLQGMDLKNQGGASDNNNKNSGGGGLNLSGYSSSELAAELERRTKPQMQTRTSVENFLGAAAQLNPQVTVESLLANPFASRNSFHRGSASNLLSVARANSFHKNSTSNLLNAVRNSFHKNSTSNLLNASMFAKNSSSRSNLLNAAASSFGKNSTSNSNLFNAARAAEASGLSSFLKREQGGMNARHSGASLSDLLERHNSGLDFQRSLSNLGNTRVKNWSAGGGSGSGSQSHLANLRLSLQNDGGSNVFGSSNATFGQDGNNASALAKFLQEQQGEGPTLGSKSNMDKQQNLSAEMIEKEALMQTLRASGFDSDKSPIAEYLLKQQMSNQMDNAPQATSNSSDAQAKLIQMMNLKRKFLEAADTGLLGDERATKRFR